MICIIIMDGQLFSSIVTAKYETQFYQHIHIVRQLDPLLLKFLNTSETSRNSHRSFNSFILEQMTSYRKTKDVIINKEHVFSLMTLNTRTETYNSISQGFPTLLECIIFSKYTGAFLIILKL